MFSECGQEVVERAEASPKIGECVGNTSGDPRVFGPDAWRTWHRLVGSEVGEQAEVHAPG